MHSRELLHSRGHILAGGTSWTLRRRPRVPHPGPASTVLAAEGRGWRSRERTSTPATLDRPDVPTHRSRPKGNVCGLRGPYRSSPCCMVVMRRTAPRVRCSMCRTRNRAGSPTQDPPARHPGRLPAGAERADVASVGLMVPMPSGLSARANPPAPSVRGQMPISGNDHV
jgi:hypothetical protein